MRTDKHRINHRMVCILCFFLLFCVIFKVPADALVIKKKGTDVVSDLENRIAEAKDEISKAEVGSYGMTPVYGRDIRDGTYEISGESDSPFFKLAAAELTVQDGDMKVRFMIPSLSYAYVYPGSAEKAEAAETEELIKAEEADSCSYFSISVDALNRPMECAAFSKKKQRWYDRKILFDASSLPEEALLIELPDYEAIEAALKAYETAEGEASETEGTEVHKEPEAVDVARSDGEYSIEADMTGGSGRASISSPTLLTVRDGKGYARLLWSSAYYDYMIVEGETYWNLTTDGGNSVFEIPITVMDKPMPVIADTTAMGDPVEIEYVLTFYSDSIGDRSLIPQEAAKKVLVIAALIIVIGGILNYFVKKRRR